MESATLSQPRLRAVPRRVWERVGLAVLVLAAAIGVVVYPTHPTYDAIYALVWGRELLDGTLPSFDAYRAPTQHPLAVAVGTILAPLGDAGARVFLLAVVASFCALVAGAYRLGRAAFTPLVGLVAALLVLTRLDYAFLAVRGYVDIPYLACVAWAAALETERPRRGGAVWALLVAAGLLRPEAWLLAGAYWLWCGRSVRNAAYAALAPLLWVLTDLVATGHPLFSLQHTSTLAGQLGRDRTAADAPRVAVDALLELLKWPVLAGALLGVALAWRFARRRSAVLLVTTASGAVTFALIVAAGLSVVDRYLAVTGLGLLLFAAFAVAGFTTLPAGDRARRPWAVAAAVVVVAGGAFTALHLHPGSIDRELTLRGQLRAELDDLVHTPAFARARRCGPVSVPNHKLVPDVRWLLDAGVDEVVARSARRDAGRTLPGAAISVSGARRLDTPTYGPLGPRAADRPLDLVPGADARLIARTPHFAAYATCR